MNHTKKLNQAQHLKNTLVERLTIAGIDFQEIDLELHVQIAQFLQKRLSPESSLIQVATDYIHAENLQHAINHTIKPATKGSETLAFLNDFGNLVDLPKVQFFRILEANLGHILTYEGNEVFQHARELWSVICTEYGIMLGQNNGKPFPLHFDKSAICLNRYQAPITPDLAVRAAINTPFNLSEFTTNLSLDFEDQAKDVLQFLSRHKLLIWNKTNSEYTTTDLGKRCLLGETFLINPCFNPILQVPKRGNDPEIIKTLFAPLVKAVEELFYDHITLYRSTRLIGFDIDLDVTVPYLSFDHTKEAATIHLPLVAPVAPNPVVDEKMVDLVVKDFEEHFKSTQKSDKPTEFQDFLRFLLACRMAGSRKRCYLWLWCFSDWGKGLVLGGVFKNLGIVCTITAGDIIKAYEGGNVGLDAHDLKYHWILWIDEFSSNSDAIKLLDQDFVASPKYALRFSAPTYAKVFTSATDVKSLSGAGNGVEEQMVNRFSLLNVARENLKEAERALLKLNKRPVFEEVTDDLYRKCLETYVAKFFDEHLQAYAALPVIERHRMASNEINEWHKNHPLIDPEESQSFDESITRIAKNIKTAIRTAQNRFVDNQRYASKERNLENDFWSLPPAIQSVIGSIKPIQVKEKSVFFLRTPEAMKVVDAFIQLEHFSFRTTLSKRSNEIVRNLHEVELAPFESGKLPRVYFGKKDRPRGPIFDLVDTQETTNKF